MLEIRNLEKSFGKNKVLHDISLSVEKGDVTVLMGPSGAGKTTLVRCMNMLERPDRGEMIFKGVSYDMRRMNSAEIRSYRMKTAFVFQEFNLFLNKTALQNVTEGLVVARGMNREAARLRGLAMLDRVGLADWADYYPHQLSGGQKQRVAIARALAADPEIIFFDEPTSALDPNLIGEVTSVIRSLAQDGMTMMIITHVPEFAKSIANKALFMDAGKIIEAGASDQFFSCPKSEQIKEFLKAGGTA